MELSLIKKVDTEHTQFHNLEDGRLLMTYWKRKSGQSVGIGIAVNSLSAIPEKFTELKANVCKELDLLNGKKEALPVS